MTVVAKGRTAPMGDAQYEAWRDVLTTFDQWVTIVEGDYRRAEKGTPRTVARARLDAFTKARDSVLAVVRREQERRQEEPA